MGIENRSIFVTFQKEGIHCYPEAPLDVDFLRYPHRHMFHFHVTIDVVHNDRDIEFIRFKRELESQYDLGLMQVGSRSCEMLAEELIEYIVDKYPNRNVTVSVSEDKENGATLTWKS